MVQERIQMKKSRFSDAQIMGILAQAENGVSVQDACYTCYFGPNPPVRYTGT